MSESGSHVRLLLRTRWRAIRNRFGRGGALPKIVGTIVTTAVVLIALGHLAAPSLLEPPTEVATGGGFGQPDTLPAGTTALEAAFWLTVLAAAVTSFRVMELLFRRKDIRAVETYPVALPALFVDRVLASVAEAGIAAGFISLFFVPLAWHGRADVFGLCALVAFTGMTASGLASLAIQIYAGDLNARSSGAKKDGRASGADIYGGPGQLFMFSPGLALATSAIVILLARLSIGELLGSGANPRGFWFGAGVIWGSTVIVLLAAMRRFVARFPRMAARFREADVVHYEAHLDYQTSAYAERRWFETILPASSRPHYRTLALQYGRGHSVVRYSYVIAWIVAGVALTQWSRSAFPSWAVGLVPTVIAATMANPWYRIVQPPLHPEWAKLLPIESADEWRAGLALGARESLLIATPYAALVLLVDWSAGPTLAGLEAALAMTGGLALNGVMAAAWSSFGPSVPAALGIPAAACVALIVASIISLPVGLGLACLLALLQLIPALSRTKSGTNTTEAATD